VTHVQPERQPFRETLDSAVGPRDRSQARIGICRLTGLLDQLLGHQVRLRPARQILLQVPENPQAAGIDVTLVKERHLGRNGRENLR
jgi:hypothetical protein